jgi:hypothetical protein
VKHLENGFADRHHLLTVVEVKAGPQNRSGKKRQKTATNLPQFAAMARRILSQLAALRHRQLPQFASSQGSRAGKNQPIYQSDFRSFIQLRSLAIGSLCPHPQFLDSFAPVFQTASNDKLRTGQ